MKTFRKIFRWSMLIPALISVVLAVLYFCTGFNEVYLKIIVALELVLIAMEITLMIIDKSISKNDKL